jgi:UDP-glucose 4-epimerase
MKHYLVTGGCGFIGSHLTHELVKAGHKVTVLDNLSNGYIRNIAPGTSFVKGCITDGPLLKSLMKNIDGCFHLAAITSPERCNKEWEQAHAVNVTGTLHVFSQARGRQIPVVYASSAAVYGHQQDFPIKEDALIRPLSSYGRHKYSGELEARITAIPTIGIRFFNVYGPQQGRLCPYSGVISIFIHRALNQKNLIIHGDGHQVRDFLYISDAIRMLVAAMEKLHTIKAGHYVINACTGKKTTIKDLAELIITLTYSKVKCLYGTSNKGDIYESVGNPSFLKKILGITAKTSIVNGIRQTIRGIV